MFRMGHSSSRAALICRHATEERDEAIADALDEVISLHETNDEDDNEEQEEDRRTSAAFLIVHG
jgi:hypothetical protein